MMRLGISLLILLVTHLTAAKTVLVTQISFAGAPVGTNTTTIDEGGQFLSKSEIKLGSLSLQEEVRSTFTKGHFGAFEMTHKQGERNVQVRLKGREVTITEGKSTTTKTLSREPKAFFANFHPQLARTLSDYKSAAGSSDTEIFLLDNVTFVSASLSVRPNRIVKQNGTPFSADFYELNLQGLKIELGIDPRSGWVLGMNVPSQRGSYLLNGVEDLFIDPLSKVPELSQPTHTAVTEPYELSQMRDGTPLRATVVRPREPGKYPAILVRTPYGRAAMADYYGSIFTPRGYVVVAQDVRGMGGSLGDWDPFMNERKDGYDTVQWVAKQPWSDGNVGMIGGSYVGMVQWQAAVEQPPALKCIIPQVSPPDPFYNIPFDHGAFMLRPNAWWTKIVSKKDTDMSSAGDLSADPKKFLGLPLSTIDNATIGFDVPFWDRWLARDTAERWAGANYQADLSRVKIPVLMVSGWWDGDLAGTTMNWDILRRAGHDQRWLIMGPWVHAFNTSTKVADEDYGSEAVVELDSVYLRFFDTFLKGKSVHFEDRSRAQVFLTGSNEWRGMNDYPHKLAQEKRLVLSSKRDARNARSDGTLGDAPGIGESTISYDPADVIAKSNLNSESSLTFRFDDLQGDELFFKTAPMTQPLDIAGPISLEFSFKSTAQDCDFYAFLVDITENGLPRLIQQGGKIRASYLHSMDQRKPLVPGQIYRAKISLWDVAHEFKPGHRIGLIISCNLFPNFDRNLGYAEAPLTATRMRKSVQTIFHNQDHPAFLSFQVLPPLE
ncbi:MAG: CocE/NonD family hydrolase [Fimbriimonadaceae bacterium]|nr:CocE/NonD family hydrolase [Fimbriimonadaceae bacterium]